MLYKDIDMMFNDNAWFEKFTQAKKLYDNRWESLEALNAYKDMRKELKNEFDMKKMMG